MNERIIRKIQGLVFPALLIILWQGVSYFGWVNPYLLPSPGDIIGAFTELLFTGEIFIHIKSSLFRLGVGMAITMVLAVPLGLFIGLFSRAQKFITPTLAFLQQIPTIAWIPVFILWLGIGEGMKIALMVYAAFFPVFINTLFGIQSVDQKLKEVARAFSLGYQARITHVYLPSAAPHFFVGIRLGFSNCWRALVAAEIIASAKGLGYLLMEGRNLAQSELIFVSIFVIGSLGALIDYGIKYLEQRVLPWHKA
ncbi:ABC transporter permease [Desulfitobacterium chlororespirans]|uniref:Sulfonate transport system permease protein n=1 Tax=Desulfitobacterium chlororespirans DSM 11544 TaxID=1121395 RepID=A0A1M7U7U0_9FIRM|nr:ABC transporter permease [Desulfitobacterium chlororespirans]SHN78985.1 sulfonate transport system permease protein [Desulfitobacterium chlororespirans DSM 11544]